MPRTCTVCAHQQREKIDAALVVGEPYRRIATHFETSEAAIRRHKAHLPGAIAKAQEAKEVVRADSLLDQIRQLTEEARGILKTVRESDPKTAVAAVRAIAQTLELQAKILGELRPDTQLNILVSSPQWLAVEGAILRALDPFPAAKEAVITAMRHVLEV